jgi:hypothetical protein
MWTLFTTVEESRRTDTERSRQMFFNEIAVTKIAYRAAGFVGVSPVTHGC